MGLINILSARSELSEGEALSLRDAIRADIDGAGGAKVVAGLLERKLSTVYGWSEARESGNKFRDVGRLVRLLGGEGRIVRDLCRLAGGTFAPHRLEDLAAKLGDTGTVLTWSCDVFERAAEVVKELRAGLADGRLTASEKKKLLLKVEHLDEAVEALRLLARGEVE